MKVPKYSKIRGVNVFDGISELKSNCYFKDEQNNISGVARKEGYYGFIYRIICMWRVLTGYADIVVWRSKEQLKREREKGVRNETI